MGTDGRRSSRGKPGARPLRRSMARPSARRPGRRSAINGRDGKEAFLRRFDGLCFRCLSSRHHRIDCRDPLHCIICKQPGHFGRECPLNPKRKGHAGCPTRPPQRGPVHERLRFPSRSPPPPPPPPPGPRSPAMAAMDREAFHTDASRRPRSSFKMVISTPAIEQQEFLLRKHAVLLTASTARHAANPMSVGRAIEE
ncbi:hypothetical protein VPH35_077383 [Triticum aestivum]|uniref:CCHC-type domain-containing protein n=1 Tax=Aegilops tauschii subsp. strangulata TaxID=200361 RepID=A0A453HPU6_AEGTS